jgi:nickel-dependent lactate racemase
MTIKVENSQAEPLTDEQIEGALKRSLEGRKLGKVLVIPPDFTRFHSNAGYITSRYYHLLKDKAEVDILPALGTHDPMTETELT